MVKRKTFKHIEVRDIRAKVLRKFKNTKKGLLQANIMRRKKIRDGSHIFIYRVSETRLM